MVLRRMSVLPVFAFALIIIFNLIIGEVFYSLLWSFAALLLFFVTFPIAIDMQNRTTPLFQIFTSLPLLIFILAAAAFYDFNQTGISLLESLFFSIAIGFIIVAFLMALKGK